MEVFLLLAVCSARGVALVAPHLILISMELWAALAPWSSGTVRVATPATNLMANLMCNRYARDELAGDHREKSEPKTHAVVAKGIPIPEAKRIPRARAALDSQWNQLWGLMLSVKEYDQVRREALSVRAVKASDAQQAYTQSKHKGIETWIFLPRDQWPKRWETKCKDRVVKLRVAHYGRPLSGAIWESHCTARWCSVEFEPVQTWESAHLDLGMTLSVYVDDFKLAGPEVIMNSVLSRRTNRST